jgi:hypothetical protein
MRRHVTPFATSQGSRQSGGTCPALPRCNGNEQ